MPSTKGELSTLKRLISEADLILETTPALPENRTARCRELLRTALALIESAFDSRRDGSNETAKTVKELLERLKNVEQAIEAIRKQTANFGNKPDQKDEQENDEELLAKYRASAERGESWGQHNLGVVYSNGRLVPKDKARAGYWYRKAADQGDIAAMQYLADLLSQGNGVAQDYPEAVRLYEVVANSGHTYTAMAEHSLGNIYSEGHGVIRDYARAVEYWRKAAEHGWASLAATALAGLYKRGGEGFPSNFEEAYFWSYVAVSANEPKEVSQYRIDERDEMARRLDAESRRRVQERAHLWLAGKWEEAYS
jgi:TPR repeat protein